MPDIDEHQRLINENLKYSLQEQQYLKIINNLIPDIWAEIGKISYVMIIPFERMFTNNSYDHD